MEDLVQRVVARFRDRFARPIHVDKALIKTKSDRLAEHIAILIKDAMSPADLDEPIGHYMAKLIEAWSGINYFDMPMMLMDGRTVKGENIRVPIYIESKHGSDDLFFVSAATRIPPAHNESLELNVVIYLNAQKTYRDFATMGGDFEAGFKHQLYMLLIHEMTHVAEHLYIHEGRPEEGTENRAKRYYNQPHEVRAYMQQIVDHALSMADAPTPKKRYPKPNDYVMFLIRTSDRWQRIEPHLSEANKHLIMKAVYQALDEAGKLPEVL